MDGSGLNQCSWISQTRTISWVDTVCKQNLFQKATCVSHPLMKDKDRKQGQEQILERKHYSNCWIQHVDPVSCVHVRWFLIGGSEFRSSWHKQMEVYHCMTQVPTSNLLQCKKLRQTLDNKGFEIQKNVDCSWSLYQIQYR